MVIVFHWLIKYVGIFYFLFLFHRGTYAAAQMLLDSSRNGPMWQPFDSGGKRDWELDLEMNIPKGPPDRGASLWLGRAPDNRDTSFFGGPKNFEGLNMNLVRNDPNNPDNVQAQAIVNSVPKPVDSPDSNLGTCTIPNASGPVAFKIDKKDSDINIQYKRQNDMQFKDCIKSKNFRMPPFNSEPRPSVGVTSNFPPEQNSDTNPLGPVKLGFAAEKPKEQLPSSPSNVASESPAVPAKPSQTVSGKPSPRSGQVPSTGEKPARRSRRLQKKPYKAPSEETTPESPQDLGKKEEAGPTPQSSSGSAPQPQAGGLDKQPSGASTAPALPQGQNLSGNEQPTHGNDLSPSTPPQQPPKVDKPANTFPPGSPQQPQQPNAAGPGGGGLPATPDSPQSPPSAGGTSPYQPAPITPPNDSSGQPGTPSAGLPSPLDPVFPSQWNPLLPNEPYQVYPNPQKPPLSNLPPTLLMGQPIAPQTPLQPDSNSMPSSFIPVAGSSPPSIPGPPVVYPKFPDISQPPPIIPGNIFQPPQTPPGNFDLNNPFPNGIPNLNEPSKPSDSLIIANGPREVGPGMLYNPNPKPMTSIAVLKEVQTNTYSKIIFTLQMATSIQPKTLDKQTVIPVRTLIQTIHPVVTAPVYTATFIRLAKTLIYTPFASVKKYITPRSRLPTKTVFVSSTLRTRIISPTVTNTKTLQPLSFLPTITQHVSKVLHVKKYLPVFTSVHSVQPYAMLKPTTVNKWVRLPPVKIQPVASVSKFIKEYLTLPPLTTFQLVSKQPLIVQYTSTKVHEYQKTSTLEPRLIEFALTLTPRQVYQVITSTLKIQPLKTLHPPPIEVTKTFEPLTIEDTPITRTASIYNIITKTHQPFLSRIEKTHTVELIPDEDISTTFIDFYVTDKVTREARTSVQTIRVTQNILPISRLEQVETFTNEFSTSILIPSTIYGSTQTIASVAIETEIHTVNPVLMYSEVKLVEKTNTLTNLSMLTNSIFETLTSSATQIRTKTIKPTRVLSALNIIERTQTVQHAFSSISNVYISRTAVESMVYQHQQLKTITNTLTRLTELTNSETITKTSHHDISHTSLITSFKTFHLKKIHTLQSKVFSNIPIVTNFLKTIPKVVFNTIIQENEIVVPHFLQSTHLINAATLTKVNLHKVAVVKSVTASSMCSTCTLVLSTKTNTLHVIAPRLSTPPACKTCSTLSTTNTKHIQFHLKTKLLKSTVHVKKADKSSLLVTATATNVHRVILMTTTNKLHIKIPSIGSSTECKTCSKISTTSVVYVGIAHSTTKSTTKTKTQLIKIAKTILF